MAARTEYQKQKRKEARVRYYQRHRAEMEADPQHPFHGTRKGYEVGCRCESCTQAARIYRKQHKLKLLRDMQSRWDHPSHGTMRGYDYGCRCPRCKVAASEARREARHAKQDKAQ